MQETYIGLISTHKCVYHLRHNRRLKEDWIDDKQDKTLGTGKIKYLYST